MSCGHGTRLSTGSASLQRHFCILAPSAATIRGQRPSSHHSRYRLYAVSHFPYSSGISRHDSSVPTTVRMPLRIVRWSCRRRPVRGCCGGSTGRTRSHSASVSAPRARAAGSIVRSVVGWLRARAWRAAWQRAATAWCARRQRDQPNLNPRCAIGLAQREHQAARFRHGERDHPGFAIPFLPSPAASARACARSTTRSACASRQSVMNRCHASQVRTS